MEEYHKPVLLSEVIKALDVKKGAWYLDCTLGDGGHSLEILRLGGNVVGMDVDPEALERAKERLGSWGYLGKIKLVQGNFRDLKKLISQADLADLEFAGVIFDLGVSSLQLMSPERGFSFAKVGPLDMRMDPSLQVRALDLINGLNKGELYELFSKLGEEKNSRALAAALVSARQVRPISSTRDLAQILERVVGRRKGQIHPATKVFQALRMAVNDELNALEEALPKALEVTLHGGHILVISFHSLEDRIAKISFKLWQNEGLGQVLTKKPMTPSDDEVRKNPRSRSAKLRIFEVIKNDHSQKIRSRSILTKIS